MEAGYRESAAPGGKRWRYRAPFPRFMAMFALLFVCTAIPFRHNDAMIVFAIGALLCGVVGFFIPESSAGFFIPAWLPTTIELGPVALTTRTGLFRAKPIRVERGEIARFEVRRHADHEAQWFAVQLVDREGHASPVLDGLTADEAIYLAVELDEELRRDDPLG